MKTLNGIVFNAETEQAAGVQGDLINNWGCDASPRVPIGLRGLRRRRHLRQPPSMSIFEC